MDKNITNNTGAVQGKSSVLKLNKKVSTADFIVGDKTRRLATEKHPTIEAVINGLFRFEKIEQALARLEAIKNNFIISSKLPKDDDENSVKLWIRGFQISEKEEKDGYLGNYAQIGIENVAGKFRLLAIKQDIALKYHPQRKRPKRRNPDWGHPALRIVKKGIVFDDIEEAQKILAQLHEEYPEVSIPNTNKLFIIIYSKALDMKPPVQKFVLEIKPSREGGFIIEYKVNNHQKKTKVDAKPKGEEKKAVGYYTAMAALKKNKRKSSIKKKKEDQ